MPPQLGCKGLFLSINPMAIPPMDKATTIKEKIIVAIILLS